jgi:stage II sporulation protein D
LPEKTRRRDIHAWSPRARFEPTIRIGVILAEDACGRVDLRLTGAAGYVGPDASAEVPIADGTALSIERSDRGLHVAGVPVPLADGPQVRVRTLPVDAVEEGCGALVRDVVAGRGFHWQKRIDQLLPGTIEVRPAGDGLALINEVPLEAYLAGVITAEMSGACPAALLEAQCICARSWLLAMTERKHADEPFDRCNDDCCQRYQGVGCVTPTAFGAVRQTYGVALMTSRDAVVDANYAKCCGGIGESPTAVWGVEKPGLGVFVDAPDDDPVQRMCPVSEENLRAYLTGDWLAGAQAYCGPNVVPPADLTQYLGRVDDAGEYFRWSVTHTGAALLELLRSQVADMAAAVALHDLRVMKRGVSGRATRLAIDWADRDGRMQCSELASEYAIRAALHERFLLSSAIAFDLRRNDAGQIVELRLTGAGWGHGVGLCQIGALGMALRGHDSATILRHYYPGARLGSAY